MLVFVLVFDSVVAALGSASALVFVSAISLEIFPATTKESAAILLCVELFSSSAFFAAFARKNNMPHATPAGTRAASAIMPSIAHTLAAVSRDKFILDPPQICDKHI